MSGSEVLPAFSPTKLLLDTNVWVDYYIGMRKGHADSFTLIRRAIEVNTGLYVPMHCTKDLFYFIALWSKKDMRKMNGGRLSQGAANAANELAWGCVQHLNRIATPVGCDQSDAWLAIKQKTVHADYEDNLVIAAAMRANAILVTNNADLIKHSPVAALSVRDAIAYLGTLDKDCEDQ